MKKQNIDAKLIAGVIVVILLCVFVFNLFDMNDRAGLDDYTKNANITEVKLSQKGDVKSLENTLAKLDAIDARGGSTESMRAWYRKRFKNCVVIGDSLTEGLSVYGWLTKQQVFANVGGSILSDASLFKKASKTYPKAAFFAFGMNDMGNYSGSSKNFISDYEKRIKAFHHRSKDTKIYVCSISTPAKSVLKKRKILRNYKKFNTAIEKMCEKNGWTYVDASGILPAHKKLYAGDGIHAASKYYPLWMDTMIEAAGL